MSKPSILFINRVYPPKRGATGRMVQDLAHALTANGWKVTVLTTSDKKKTFVDAGVEVRCVKASKNPKKLFGFLFGLSRLLRLGLSTPRHDIVVTLSDPPLLVSIGCFLSSVKKSRHIHWCQDMYPDLFTALGIKIPKFILKRAKAKSRRCMKKCDQIVTVGRCMVKRLTHTGVDPMKVKFIANWSDAEMFKVGKSVNPELAEKYVAIAKKPEEMFRDESPKFRVLYAGNIGRAHSVNVILDAAELLSEHSEVEFLFVGEGTAHKQLVKERARRGIENVKFLPYQPIDKLKNLMESGDVHIISMKPETTGMLVPCKFYSAISVGRPSLYLGKKDSEIGHVIEEYNAGKILSGENLGEQLAEAIYAYRHDGESWFEAQQGALQAAQVYHPSNSLKLWIDLLEDIRLKG